MKIIATTALLAYVCIAAADDSRNEPFERDPGRFIERLIKAVPRGSPMQQAYDYVEARGFENCLPHTDAHFSSISPSADFVLCTRVFGGNLYEVSFFHKGRPF